MVKLGVNIDHIATVRQARKEGFPRPIDLALEAVSAGAEGITAHLREDRRHIQDQDIWDIKKNLPVPLNMEMAIAKDVVQLARQIKPDWVCLVPERREELTTEGGLDVISQSDELKSSIAQLKAAGIKISIFIDPIINQIKKAQEIGADAIEIHTGTYARLFHQSPNRVETELKRIKEAAETAKESGIIVNAGHGLNYDNVESIKNIFKFNEFNIGFSIVSRALSVGMAIAVKEMKSLLIE